MAAPAVGMSWGTARAALVACPQLGALDPRSLESLAVAATTRTYLAGDTVFLTGTPGDAMFVLLRGLVVARVRSASGDVVDLGVATAGDAFGYMEVVAPVPRTSDAVALRDSTVLALPRGPVRRALQAQPEALFALLHDMVRIVGRQNAAIATRARPVAHRVAALLLDQPHVDGHVRFDGSQALLAQRLGVARQTLNAALRELAGAGLLTIHPGGRSVTLDRERLTAWVDGT